MNPQEAFLDILIAAMKDACLERKLTQIQTQLNPDGNGLRVVRIIVVPEQMEYRWPSQAPLGTPKS
jgi:hypothetical protein